MIPADTTTSAQRPRHWADREAEAIAASGASQAIVCTGISPSGPFHVGHLREIITGDAVRRALADRGVDARLLFVVDNLDPLRKVYDFLDPARYAGEVGRPLAEVPAPEGDGTYDEYFLRPFLAALERLRVDCDVVRASELYGSGRMDEVVFDALDAREEIARILAETTGKTVAPDWSPFNPRSPETGRITRCRVLDHDRGRGVVRFVDTETGREHEAPPRAGGKLTWRVDWPARWKALGVTVEPFGKDHASRGGSYDSGRRIARAAFGCEAPHPIVYEWIALAGGGDMSASKGNVLTVGDLLEVVPPEVLRYFVLKNRPNRRLVFDPGLPLLRLVDEVDDAQARGRDDRALELSRAGGFRPVGVPFHHLVTVGQIAGFDLDRALELLRRGGFEGLDREAVAQRLAMAERWLARFAPADMRLEVPAELPRAARALSPEQRALLRALAAELDAAFDPEAFQDAVRRHAEGPSGPGARAAFQAIYRALLGRDRGPRAGSLIALLGPEFARRRFVEAAEAG